MKNCHKLALSSLLLSLTLGSCGRDQTVPEANAQALGALRTQSLTWGSCDPTLIPEPARQIVLDQIGNRLQCADITVPMDWNNPSHGNATVGLLRVSASAPATRQGAIFFNPGGPGGDGLLMGVSFGYLWDRANTKTPSGAALKKLSEQYDLIGFSPRGTGDSSRLSCGLNASGSALHNPSADRSQKNIDAMLRNAKLVAGACQKSTFAPYVNTAQTVQDLDLARQLMGDEKLNYIGYSYGTWLGSWYAETFPANTGKVLLDANMDFSSEISQAFLNQSLGFERAFREVALGFASRHNDIFELGATVKDVYSVYDSFQPDLKFALQEFGEESIIGDLYTAEGATSVAAKLVSARGVSTLLKQNPGAKSAEELFEALGTYTFARNTQLNEAARRYAYPLTAAYFSLLNEESLSVELGASPAVFNAVVCNDSNMNKDPQHWVNLGNEYAQKYPLTGGQITQNPCIYWKNTPSVRPALPADMPPIMMLQTENDPATPKEGAFNAFKNTPTARMIFIDNEGRHGSFPYGTSCVDLPVANYFLTGALPQDRFTACQARPLPGEKEVYPYGQSYVSGLGPQGLGNAPGSVAGAVPENTFGESGDTRQIEQLVKEIIRRNAIQPLAR